MGCDFSAYITLARGPESVYTLRGRGQYLLGPSLPSTWSSCFPRSAFPCPSVLAWSSARAGTPVLRCRIGGPEAYWDHKLWAGSLQCWSCSPPQGPSSNPPALPSAVRVPQLVSTAPPQRPGWPSSDPRGPYTPFRVPSRP